MARSRSRTFGSSSSSGFGKRLLGILLLLVVVIFAGSAVFLGTWERPAPTETVEKVIPNERFQR